MKRTLLTLAIVIFCFGTARATDYYVDGNNGSNTTGDGTQAKPWKSITYALSRVTAGAEVHTIHVAAAVYDTTL